MWELLRAEAPDEAPDEAFSALSGEVALKADMETEVVTLSVRVASVSATGMKEEPGAVGRSGFLGNSMRVSSESRERLSEPSQEQEVRLRTLECSLMVKNDT